MRGQRRRAALRRLVVVDQFIIIAPFEGDCEGRVPAAVEK
jgi:hypothetical protein